MAVAAETRPGTGENPTTKTNKLVWDIGLEARSVLPDDVKSISEQVLRWMNPDQGWQLRRITALGFGSVSDRPIPQEKLEQFLTGKTLPVDPDRIFFIFHLRATNPPELYEKRGFTRKLVFVPQNMFTDVVDRVDVSSLLSTKGPIISILKLPVTGGMLRTSDPYFTDASNRYYFIRAVVCLDANRTFPNMEGMSRQDGVWPNIFLELSVGNTYSAIVSKIEDLKRRLEAMEASLEAKKRNIPANEQNTSQISS